MADGGSDFPFSPLESVLAAREWMKYNRIKTQHAKKDLMQDSPTRQTLERSLAVLVRHEP